MNENDYERLDAALSSGASFDGDAELSELRQVAALIRREARHTKPSTDAMQRGRARLLAAVNAQRRQHALGWRALCMQWVSTLSAPALMPRRVAYMLTIVLVVYAGNRVLAVSANSLPGDPLYELKRIQEQVTLTLAPSEQKRDHLRDEYAQQRARELSEVQQQHRVTRTTLEGIVQSVTENVLVVSGVTMQLTSNTLGTVSQLQVGARVSVIVQSNADGSLEAISISVIPLTPTATLPSSTTTNNVSASATPRPTLQPTSAVPPSATSEPTRDVTTTHTADATRTPTATRSDDSTRAPTATQAPQSSRTPETTQTPQPSQTPKPTQEPSQSPQPTQTPKPTQEPSQTPQPTQSPKPTQTQAPTQTPQATQTQKPTQTPEPTRTSTPVTPTRTPEPTRIQTATR